MPNSEQTGPHVRYARSEDNQYPYLHHWNEPIPDDARFVSPIYALTDEQAETNQWYRKNGAYKAPNAKQIAKQSMDDCENHAKPGRVLYPIQLDVDGYKHGATPEDAIGTVRLFIQELGFSPDEEHWYLSGGEARNPKYKGTHCHLPAVCTYEELWAIKQQAQSYNQKLEQLSTPLQLDAQVYSKKRLFRLPGAEHEETGNRKVPIDRNGSRESTIEYQTYQDIARATGLIAQSRSVFEEYTREEGGRVRIDAGDVNREPLPTESSSNPPNGVLKWTSKSTTPIGDYRSESIGNWVVDRSRYPHYTGEGVQQCYQAHHRQPFSPYKWGTPNYEEAGRSVAAVMLWDGAFTPLRERHKWVNYDRDEYEALLPSMFYGAIGRNGTYRVDPYTHRPLYLGKQCYNNNREEIAEAEALIVIMGQNNLAHVHAVPNVVAYMIGDLLLDEGRQAALDSLEERGYEVGRECSNDSERHYRDGLPNESEYTYEPSEMQQLQEAIEAGERSVLDLERNEHLRLGNRLLQIHDCDRRPIYEWYREQYGPDYSQAITDAQLDYIERSYDDLGSGATEIEL